MAGSNQTRRRPGSYGGGGGGGTGNSIVFKQTIYTGTTNPATSTNATFEDISATLYPALSLTLAVDDVVMCEMLATFGSNSTGTIIGFDWLIDRPTSADTTIRAIGSKAAAWLHEYGTNAADANTLNPTGYFVCTEEGVHTFKPQWRHFSSGITTVLNTGASYFGPSVHRVTNLGAVTA